MATASKNWTKNDAGARLDARIIGASYEYKSQRTGIHLSRYEGDDCLRFSIELTTADEVRSLIQLLQDKLDEQERIQRVRNEQLVASPPLWDPAKYDPKAGGSR